MITFWRANDDIGQMFGNQPCYQAQELQTLKRKKPSDLWLEALHFVGSSSRSCNY